MNETLEALDQDLQYAILLLGEWQSMHAILPPRYQAKIEELNRKTIILLTAADGVR